MIRRTFAAVVLACAALSSPAAATAEKLHPLEPFFYTARDYGSEAAYNPFTMFIQYSIDSLQVTSNFDAGDLDRRYREVWNNLVHPGDAIEDTGGFGAFIDRQIFPINWNDWANSRDMLPNYFLHLLGGGMVYRKDAEWFDAHGYRYPRLYSALIGTVAEFIQEGFEKKTTKGDDEVADILIYRPLGMLLFSSDRAARFAAQKLRLAAWPSQPTYNVNDGKIANIGLSYALRPAWPWGGDTSFFALVGMNTLLGVSMKVNESESLSIGFGSAVLSVVRRKSLTTRFSWGAFYDRNGSLLWSAIVRGTEKYAFRFNLYPRGPGKTGGKAGFFMAVEDDGSILTGVTVNLFPIGITGRLHRGTARIKP